MIKVTVIGNGNLGTHWCHVLSKNKDISLLQWYGRSFSDSASATFVGVPTINQIQKLTKADVYILAVSDDAIGTVSSQLPKGVFTVHCSGSVSLNTLKNQGQKGVLYPVQSFSKEHLISFKGVPFCIEATTAEVLSFLRHFCELLGVTATAMTSEQRKYLHLAAVIVNNFSNHLFVEGAKICETHALPFELLHPLIEETAAKIKRTKPKHAQTGPAIRNDHNTLQKHEELLKKSPFKKTYTTLSKAIQNQ